MSEVLWMVTLSALVASVWSVALIRAHFAEQKMTIEELARKNGLVPVKSSQGR